MISLAESVDGSGDLWLDAICDKLLVEPGDSDLNLLLT